MLSMKSYVKMFLHLLVMSGVIIRDTELSPEERTHRDKDETPKGRQSRYLYCQRVSRNLSSLGQNSASPEVDAPPSVSPELASGR
jgi:hypothetical protein